MSDRNPYDLRAKYTRFRILVIGRANSGKTTLLQRVCNTTNDPCIYDKENKNLVSVHRTEDKFASDILSISLSLPQRYSTFYRYILVCLTLPIQRGIHDIRQPFAFKSNPGFIFHDSPGFETGDANQLQEVLSFMDEKSKSTDVDDQLHAIWSVSLSQRTYLPLMVNSLVKGFVLF